MAAPQGVREFVDARRAAVRPKNGLGAGVASRSSASIGADQHGDGQPGAVGNPHLHLPALVAPRAQRLEYRSQVITLGYYAHFT
ncbi:hypothetical protein BJP40_26075 [Streptomyces sp. CC53]|nr:hypothetical protein BJP40_26075 [Streptomyces sp. CC53]